MPKEARGLIRQAMSADNIIKNSQAVKSVEGQSKAKLQASKYREENILGIASTNFKISEAMQSKVVSS